MPVHRASRPGSAVLLSLLIALATPAALTAQRPGERVDSLVRKMTLDEKLSLLHGMRDPDPATGLGSAGYMPGVPRLGIPPLRLADGPAGIRTSLPATALPAPVAVAASFDPSLAHRFGQVIGREGIVRNQDVLLAPMVNIVRVPQGGRNFETLGEDPLLASRMVAEEIRGIEGAGMIATVKHFAANNFENGRQGIDVRVDARTLHEIYLPAFEAAAKAGVGSAMCSYNKVNGVQACANRELLTTELRSRVGFTGWVMTDWFAFHDLASLDAGLDQEMPGFAVPGIPSPVYFADSLRAAVQGDRIAQAAVDQAVGRILSQMDRFGLLGATPRARPTALDTAGGDAVARDVAMRGAVLLRNTKGALPITRANHASLVVIGPTAKTPLIGGGGSAHVIPTHTGSALAALERRIGAPVRYVPGIDLDGVTVPASALATPTEGIPGLARTALDSAIATPSGQTDVQLDFTGTRALPAGGAWTWSGTLTAPVTGEYDIKLQTRGGHGVLAIGDSVRAQTGMLFGGGSLIPTVDGLENGTTTLRLKAGEGVAVRVTIDARPTPSLIIGSGGGTPKPVEVRLAWSTPARRRSFVDDAAAAARHARAVVLFVHDEGSEGSDRSSLSLPVRQDALIDAVTRANSRTVVVLNTGSAVVMPWLDRTGAVLQVWYPGQEGGDATAALLLGDANPSGKLPVTFPRHAADAPTSDAARYPGTDGHADYSEGVLVGYRWYDTKKVTPLFPFGHGLSYTHFTYDGLSIRPSGDGFDVSFRVRNAGSVRGGEVAQVYLGAPAIPPIPMAARQLAGFDRVELEPGEQRSVTVHVGPRELSYWSTTASDWQVVRGRRAVLVGSSSRDIRLRGILTAK